MKEYNERGLEYVPSVFINGEFLEEYKPRDQKNDEVRQLLKVRISTGSSKDGSG
nr:hypothetical protein [Jeotgalicoccus meleagridis]